MARPFQDEAGRLKELSEQGFVSTPEPYNRACDEMNARLRESREASRQDELAYLQELAEENGWEWEQE